MPIPSALGDCSLNAMTGARDRAAAVVTAGRGDPAPAPGPPRATLVIRARDEARYLPTVLARVKEQTVRDHAVLVIDSGSRDATPLIAADAGARVVAMPPE